MNNRKLFRIIASICIAIAIWPIALLIVLSIMINIIPAIVTIGMIGLMAYAIYKGWDNEEPYL